MTSWTQAYPLSTTKVKDFPSGQQDNNLALEDALGREHTFAGTYGSTAGQHLPGRCGVIYYGTTAQIAALSSPPNNSLAYDTDKKQLQYYNGSSWTATGMMDGTTAQTVNGVKTFGSIPVGPDSDPTTNNQLARKKYVDDTIASEIAFPSGTKMLFYQDTAPSGWTIDSSVDDKAVYISKGSSDGGHTGGMANTYIYTVFDGGTSMSDVQVGDTFEAASGEGWSTTVKVITITDTTPGAQAGNLWATLDSGTIDDNDTAKVTARGATCDINYAAGYVHAGSWTISGLTKDAHTHPIAALNLQTESVLNHDAEGREVYVDAVGGQMGVMSTSGTEDNHYHVYGKTVADNTGAQSDSGITSNGEWRPDAYVCIICSKD